MQAPKTSSSGNGPSSPGGSGPSAPGSHSSTPARHKSKRLEKAHKHAGTSWHGVFSDIAHIPSNAVKDVKTITYGAPQGIKHAAVGGGEDFAHLLSVIAPTRALPGMQGTTSPYANQPWHTVAGAKAVEQGYVGKGTAGGELLRGHVTGSIHAFEQHPVMEALNYAGVGSLAGDSLKSVSAAGRAGRLGSRAVESERLAKIGGHVPAREPVTGNALAKVQAGGSRAAAAEVGHSPHVPGNITEVAGPFTRLNVPRAVAAGLPEQVLEGERFVPATRTMAPSTKHGFQLPALRELVDESPYTRLHQAGSRRLANLAPAGAPIVGELNRYGKVPAKAARQRDAARRATHLVDLEKHVAKLKPLESRALYYTSQKIDLEAHRRVLLAKAADETASKADRASAALEAKSITPELVALTKNSSEPLSAATRAARRSAGRLARADESVAAVGNQVEKVLQDVGIVKAGTADARRYLPQRVDSGAKFVPGKPANGRYADELTRRAKDAERAAAALRDVAPAKRVVKGGKTAGRVSRKLTADEARAELKALELEHKQSFGGKLTMIRQDANPSHGLGNTVWGNAQEIHGSSDVESIAKAAGAKRPKRAKMSARQRAAQVNTHIEDLIRVAAGRLSIKDMQMGWGSRYNDEAHAATLLEHHGIHRDEAVNMADRLDRIDQIKHALYLHSYAIPGSVTHAEDLARAEAAMPHGRTRQAPKADTPAARAVESNQRLSKAERRARAYDLRAQNLHRRAGEQLFGSHDAWEGGTPIDELKAKAAVEGEPSFWPHRQKQRRGPFTGLSGARRGEVTREATMAVKRNTGENYAAGRVDRSPDAVVHNARNVLRIAAVDDRFRSMLEQSALVDVAHLPHGVSAEKSPYVILDERKIGDLSKRREQTANALDLVGELARSGVVNELEASRAIEAYRDSLRGALPKDMHGKVRVVPREVFDQMTGEFDRVSPFVHYALDKPTTFFRTMVLKLRPMWLAGNVVGNTTMLAIKDPTPAAAAVYARQLYAHLAPEVAKPLINKLLLGLPGSAEHHAAWMNALDQLPAIRSSSLLTTQTGRLGETFMQLSRDERRSLVTQKFARVLGKAASAPEALADLSVILSDDVTRAVRAQRVMMPYVKKAKLKPQYKGMSDGDVAFDLLKSNPKFRDHVERRALDDLIDYGGLSPVERKVLRRAVPFYSWLKGISVWTGQQSAWKLALLSKAGQQGERDFEDIFGPGNVPDYIENAIITGKPHRLADGTHGVNTMPMQSLSPLGTVGDVAQIGESAVTGNRQGFFRGAGSLGSALNPVITSIGEAGGGVDYFTGKPLTRPGSHWVSAADSPTGKAIPPKGPIGGFGVGGFVNQFVGGLPQFALADKITHHGSGPASPYASGAGDYISSYLGYPRRTVDIERVQGYAEADRKRARGDFVFGG